MSTHVTDADLRAFAAGGLQPDDLLRVDAHLADCADCRRRGADIHDLARETRTLRTRLAAPAMHLSDEEVQLAARRALDWRQRASVERHLRECATCAEEVGDLRAWSSRQARRRWPMAIAATILLAALIPAALWFARTSGRQRGASIAGLAQLTPADQMQVRAALDAGVARLPDFVNDLAGSRETLMSPATPATETFALTSPVATATATDRPVFRWQPLAGADAYVVTVFDEQSNEVVRSAPLGRPEWVLDRPLARERTYVWQVAAHRNGETIVAPRAPMPPAKFRVIDADSAEVLKQAESREPSSHVLLGILSTHAGLVDEAIRQFEQVGPAEPGSDVARRSLELLHRIHGS